jgi:hypothetical protein
MKPNYMVIGSAKSATTTICSHLGKHPDVFMVACKEPQFFNHDDVFARGFDWYESLYDDAGKKPLRGEGSNASTMKEQFPQAIERIAAYAPDLKLIYAVREPFSRIESFWLEKRSNAGDLVHYDFNKSLHVDRAWFIDSSNYLAQLDAFRKYYSDDQIHVMFYEDFTVDPVTEMRRCFEFLGVDPEFVPPASNARLNSSETKRVPGPILSRLQRIPVYQHAVRRIPYEWRDKVAKRYLFRKAKSKPHWSLENREWVSDILRDDLRTFLVRYGKPSDFWSI